MNENDVLPFSSIESLSKQQNLFSSLRADDNHVTDSIYTTTILPSKIPWNNRRTVTHNRNSSRRDISQSPPQKSYYKPTIASSHNKEHFQSKKDSSLFTNPYDDEMGHLGDLSEYYIHPNDMKKLVRQYRRLSQQCDQNGSLAELERAADENKAFALFEMRGRIMEKDIERGLERRGGTAVLDDIVTTPYYRKGLCVRDACIVSKA